MEDDDLNLTLSTGEDIIIDDLDTVTIGNIDLTGIQTLDITSSLNEIGRAHV